MRDGITRRLELRFHVRRVVLRGVLLGCVRDCYNRRCQPAPEQYMAEGHRQRNQGYEKAIVQRQAGSLYQVEVFFLFSMNAAIANRGAAKVEVKVQERNNV